MGQIEAKFSHFSLFLTPSSAKTSNVGVSIKVVDFNKKTAIKKSTLLIHYVGKIKRKPCIKKIFCATLNDLRYILYEST